MTPAQIAATQFNQRRAWLARSGQSHAEQDAKLRPWAALALRAGADLAQLPPDLQAAIEHYLRHPLPERTARALVADDLCPLDDALATLARARDAAIDALPGGALVADPAAARKCEAAQSLQHLAIHLGAPGYRCADLVEPGSNALPAERIAA